MDVPSAPPPLYSQHDHDVPESSASAALSEPQLLIVPASDTAQFQVGYLGADAERAAIEGELQIKGARALDWGNVSISLRTTESSPGREVELGFTEVALFTSDSSTTEGGALPSSLPFAIPLLPDTPQCVHTPHTALTYTLTAMLTPTSDSRPVLTKSLTVHTRRYTSHTLTIGIAPRSVRANAPTPIEAEVPRTTFRTGELIPVYVTIPPPRRELVVDQGLRLRNVKAELVRIIRILDHSAEEDGGSDILKQGGVEVSVDGANQSTGESSSSREGLQIQTQRGTSYKTVSARSGAPCRFHTTRPVRLRLLLHQTATQGSPATIPAGFPPRLYADMDSDIECASITQTTLIHAVSFSLLVHVAFVDMTTRTERITTLSIPINVLPPSAPLPEVDDAFSDEYHKKHDRPPTRTVRREDTEADIPRYDEAGPSATSAGDPPPFEEREAPPPFFSTEAEASTSSRLPTFLESEGDFFVPPTEDESMSPLLPPPMQEHLPGEGTLFGFPPSEQFDGHSEDLGRPPSPPPTMEMATRDPNVTQLASIQQPERAIEALGLALEQHEEATRSGDLPPPPPLVDDPSDPPPSIDSEFRSPPPAEAAPPPPPHSPPRPAYEHPPPGLEAPSPASEERDQNQVASEEHAPPPYLVPESGNEHEHATGPPPYADVIPPHSERS